MPTSDYHKYLHQQYPYSTTQDLVDFLATDEFDTADAEGNADMFADQLTHVYANNFRVFAPPRATCSCAATTSAESCGASAALCVPLHEIEAAFFDFDVTSIGLDDDHTLFLAALRQVFACGAQPDAGAVLGEATVHPG